MDTLKSLRPILDQLNRAGDNLPKRLDFLLTYPFPPNVVEAISGNSVRLHATLDLNGAAILANLLARSRDSRSRRSPRRRAAATARCRRCRRCPIPVPSLPPVPAPPSRPAATHSQPPAQRQPDRAMRAAGTDDGMQMMITRIARIQVIVFLVVSLAGVAFVGIRYVGIGDQLFGDALHAVRGSQHRRGHLSERSRHLPRRSDRTGQARFALHGNLVRVGMRAGPLACRCRVI